MTTPDQRIIAFISDHVRLFKLCKSDEERQTLNESFIRHLKHLQPNATLNHNQILDILNSYDSPAGQQLFLTSWGELTLNNSPTTNLGPLLNFISSLHPNQIPLLVIGPLVSLYALGTIIALIASTCH